MLPFAAGTSSLLAYLVGGALAVVGGIFGSRGRLNYWFPVYLAMTLLGVVGGAIFTARGELFGLLLLGVGALFGLATLAMWKEGQYHHRAR